LFLPGLHKVSAPIPLGGTSNHFKTDVLKQIGGWDSFNVTEDCDLGIRLARQGQSTEVLDSTTWEEANSRTLNWIRQRSRWIKGYFQTHLVHTRDAWLPSLGMALFCGWLILFAQGMRAEPIVAKRFSAAITGSQVILGVASAAFLLIFIISLARRLVARAKGVRNLNVYQALTFRFTVGGLSLMMLLNFLLWGMTAVYLLRHEIAAVLPSSIANYPWQSSNVRQELNEWQLLHQDVKESAYAGVTLYNAVWGFVVRRISFATMLDQVGMIDRWSLISQIFYPIAITLFCGNFVIVLMGLFSCAKRNLWRLFPYALLMPFYWVLISWAAMKGFFQLFTNPWYWEKTTHGLTHAPQYPGGPAPPPRPLPAREALPPLEMPPPVESAPVRPPVPPEAAAPSDGVDPGAATTLGATGLDAG
jgi:hypothetical protein